MMDQKEQLKPVKTFTDKIIDAFNIEYDRKKSNAAVKAIIDETILKLYLSINIYMFFTNTNFIYLKELLNNDSNAIIVRDFIFNFSARACYLIHECGDKDRYIDKDTVISYITNSVTDLTDGNEFSMLPTDITNSLNVKSEELYTILSDNYWLALLYILLVNFDRTKLWDEVSSKKEPGAKVTISPVTQR
jgi:hypothetical protein